MFCISRVLKQLTRNLQQSTADYWIQSLVQGLGLAYAIPTHSRQMGGGISKVDTYGMQVVTSCLFRCHILIAHLGNLDFITLIV